MTTAQLPATLDLEMLDGDVVEYELQRRGKSHVYVGPCPGCYDRLRHVMPQEEAATTALRPFRLVDKDASELLVMGMLTMTFPVTHAGCFRGRIINNGWSRER